MFRLLMNKNNFVIGFLLWTIPYCCISFTIIRPLNENKRIRMISSQVETVRMNDIERRIIEGEVVGGTGRMGSFVMRSNPHLVAASSKEGHVAIGSLSPKGTPIYACVPATSFQNVLQNTLPDRIDDLVWVCNGLPYDMIIKSTNNNDNNDVSNVLMTYSVLHFAVLNRQDDPKIQTKALPPSTILFGKHANTFAETILHPYSIPTKIVSSIHEIQMHAIYKLLWVSSMWLLCHSSSIHHHDNTPITVKQVHTHKESLLKHLIKDEFIPVMQKIPQLRMHNNDDSDSSKTINLDDIMTYLRQYSFSMPDHTIPSKELALKEFSDRNGILFATNPKSQPIHHELIRNVTTGTHFYRDLISRPKQEITASETYRNDSYIQNGKDRWLPGIASGIHFKIMKSNIESHGKKLKRVAIVGGGMMGSCMALNLARSDPTLQIFVYHEHSEDHVGTATKASWGWLNANGKTPHHYQQLNLLGMECWKRDTMIQSLPDWCGSLVQFPSNNTKIYPDGSYHHHGPLSKEQLETLCNNELKLRDGQVHYYPQEGHVDPIQAVQQIRKSAKSQRNVHFIFNSHVDKFIYNDYETKDRVIGIECSFNDSNKKDTTIQEMMDLVILTAGTNCSSPEFNCDIPMRNSPGSLTFATNSNASRKEGKSLSKILVDTVNQVHVLEREKGILVIGGGTLQVGGSANNLTGDSSAALASSLTESSSRLNLASQLLSSNISLSEMKIEEANRPMPKDGYPAIGYLQSGIYTIITHSGMTLGPLLTELAALEITKIIQCTILDPYRPQRFFPSNAEKSKVCVQDKVKERKDEN